MMKDVRLAALLGSLMGCLMEQLTATSKVRRTEVARAFSMGTKSGEMSGHVKE
jgi:hypothetical protein